jgi:hypothetical protein
MAVTGDQSPILVFQGHRTDETQNDQVNPKRPVEDDECVMEWNTPLLDNDGDDDGSSSYDGIDLAFTKLPSMTTSDTRLHHFTNMLTSEYCHRLLRTLRNAKICKSQCNPVIKLLKSGLPEPNNMPS